MKWLYIICGGVGALVAVALITYRLYAYLGRIAAATSRYDVEMNVLVVLGIQVGILLVPMGIGLGLLAAAVIGHLVSLTQRRRFEHGPLRPLESGDRGVSWVSRTRDPRTRP